MKNLADIHFDEAGAISGIAAPAGLVEAPITSVEPRPPRRDDLQPALWLVSAR